MNPIKDAVRWTVEELLHGNPPVLLYCENDETFELFQHATTGWMTPLEGKLGAEARKLTFIYEDECVKLIEISKPLNDTAEKVIRLVTKLLNACVVLDLDYPNAQPLEPEDWDFPVIGASIHPYKLRDYDLETLFTNKKQKI